MDVSLTPATSLYDLRRQSELPTPEDLKDFVKNRRPSWLEKERTTCECCSCPVKVRVYKNVLGIGFSFTFFYSTVTALVSLQSSLNAAEGLGLTSLLVLNCCFLISAVFSSSVIKVLGTKYTIFIAYCLQATYILANYYPQWYTLLPTSIIFGLVQGPLFVSLNVHITTVAIRYAPDLNENSDNLIALFTGIFTMFFKLAYVPGNIATTVILFTERGTDDIIDTSLGNICNNTEVQNLDKTYVYILMSTYVLFAILAITISFTLLDHFGTETRFHSCGKAFNLYLKKPIVSTFGKFKDWKTCVVLALMLTDGFITSATVGVYSKIYVSDCIGVHWVGLFSLTYGLCSGIAAVIAGRLYKFLPQFVTFYFCFTVLLGTYLFLLFWEREPSYIVAFVPTALIGTGEGIWHSIPPTLVGILYPDKQETSYSVLRMGFSFGLLLGFLLSILLHHHVIFWIIVSFITVSLILYSILIFKTQTRQQLFPCLYRKSEMKMKTDESKENPIDIPNGNTVHNDDTL